MIEDPTASEDQQRPFAAGALTSTAIQLVGLVAALPTSIIVARLTGASGTAAFGLAVAIEATAVVVFGRGLGAGITFFVSRGEWSERDAWRRAQRVALGSGAVGGAAILLARALLADGALGGVTVTMAVALAVALPFALAWTFSASLLLAAERYELYGWSQAAQPALALVGAAVLAPGFDATGVVVGFAASFVVAYLLVARRMRPASAAASGRPDVLRHATRFGRRAWGADLLQLVNYRIDLFILNAFVASGVVGRYALVVSLTGLVWVLPGALQTILFPRTARLDALPEQNEMVVAAALRHSVVLLSISVTSVALLLLAVPLLYGDAFADSVRYGYLLLPGVAAIGFAKVLSATITGRGFPQYSLLNSLVTVPVTLVLYLVLIERLDGDGAAIASTLSYCLSTALAAYFFKRVTGRSPLAALRAHGGVLQDYRRALAAGREALGRLRPTRPYEPDAYWERRSRELIDTYDAPETWERRGWMRAGPEEEAVPRLIAGCRSVLVIGAGSGRQYAYLRPLAVDLRGMDISPTLAAECRRRYPDIATETDTLIGAEHRHDPADVVLSSAVLQHVPPEELQAALTSVQALARRLVIVRELQWLAEPAGYLWAHDYRAAFGGWRLVADEVTDRTASYEVRLLAWSAPGTDEAR